MTLPYTSTSPPPTLLVVFYFTWARLSKRCSVLHRATCFIGNNSSFELADMAAVRRVQATARMARGILAISGGYAGPKGPWTQCQPLSTSTALHKDFFRGGQLSDSNNNNNTHLPEVASAWLKCAYVCLPLPSIIINTSSNNIII